ncbi:MAG: hypothetical protein HOI66_23600 [Verrucomicrobia bacterium]|jgi:hypothetical protein|nr:hypothetical protein [Verrucomicrobiota bacterium]
MQLILTTTAIILACSGFIWAILRIQQINHSIKTVWPDWEGIRSPFPLWILLGLAIVTAITGGFLAGLGKTEPQNQAHSESESAEGEAYRTEIAHLKELLAEATRPQMLPNNVTPQEAPDQSALSSNQPSSPSPTPPPDVPEIPLPEKKAVTMTAEQVADPRVEALSRSVIKAVISGSMKPLEPVADKSLIDQFTINPFNFSRLQIPLKSRLEAGYTPTYMGALKSPIGMTFLWKIETVSSGPDILERLAISNGKVTGFRFDGIK